MRFADAIYVLLLLSTSCCFSGCSGHGSAAGQSSVMSTPVDDISIGITGDTHLRPTSQLSVSVQVSGTSWKSVRLMYPNLYLELIDSSGRLVRQMSGDAKGTPDRVPPIGVTSISNIPPGSSISVQLGIGSATEGVPPGRYRLRAVLEITAGDWPQPLRREFRGRSDQLWQGRCESSVVQVDLG